MFAQTFPPNSRIDVAPRARSRRTVAEPPVLVFSGAVRKRLGSSMEWAKPEHSRSQVNRAGKVLVNPQADLLRKSEASEIINNWRTSHNYPLNTFKVTLRRYASEIDADRLVAQRIKRLPSIEDKLRRYATMQVTQMQDLGGCRAILGSVNHVRALVEKYRKSDLKHELDDVDDYIATPKASGYRGVHLIYKYFSDKQAPSVYNGLFVEMQLRTRLQHAWATAVETVGTFLKQALKSSLGEEEWLRFFSLMGSVFALKEGCATVPNTPAARNDLLGEVRQIAKDLNVAYALSAYQEAIKVIRQGPERGNQFYLLLLDAKAKTTTVRSFRRRDLDAASEAYAAAEASVSDTSDAVLVSVDSVASLERAYPNYFLDTSIFLAELRSAIAQ